jgi:hypothetical protein
MDFSRVIGHNFGYTIKPNCTEDMPALYRFYNIVIKMIFLITCGMSMCITTNMRLP